MNLYYRKDHIANDSCAAPRLAVQILTACCLAACTLAIMLAALFLAPGSARAEDIITLRYGENYSGSYDPDRTVSYEFTLDDNAIVILKGIRDDRLSYLLALFQYNDNTDGALTGLDLNDATWTNYDGKIETVDKTDFTMRVTDSARQDADAFFTLSKGSYCVQAEPASLGQIPDYSFTLDIQPFIYENDPEPNDDPETAAVYKTGSWQEGQIVINGSSPDSGGQDWYAVTVPEAGSYRFDYASDGFFRGTFAWYNQKGKPVDLKASGSDVSSVSPGKTVLEALDSPHSASLGQHGDSAADYQAVLEFPEAGTFYLCASAVDAGSYKFCLSPIGASLTADQTATAEDQASAEQTIATDTSNATTSTDSSSATQPANSSGQQVELVFLLDQAFYNSNGAVTAMDTVPYIYNNRVFLPVRALATGIGIPDTGIIWNSVDRTVTLTDGSTTLSMVLDSPVLYNNGNPQTMDVSPASSSNRVFLPARYIAEAFGLTAEWEPETSSVIIRGQKSSPVQPVSSSATVSTSQPSVGTIELDRQMIGEELRKGSYNGSLLNGKPSGNGTWVDCLGRIKTGSFSMSGATDITIRTAHVAFPDGAEFTGTYTAVLYTAIEKFEGHFVFTNGNAFDGTVENTADLQQHMVGTYTLPNGNTVDVDRNYDLSGGN